MNKRVVVGSEHRGWECDAVEWSRATFLGLWPRLWLMHVAETDHAMRLAERGNHMATATATISMQQANTFGQSASHLCCQYWTQLCLLTLIPIILHGDLPSQQTVNWNRAGGEISSPQQAGLGFIASQTFKTEKYLRYTSKGYSKPSGCLRGSLV